MAFFTDDFSAFFKELAKNNNRDWFQDNKKRYETSVKKPFEAFVTEMLARISAADPSVQITAKDAILRINRDIRFSKDKTPYHQHLHMLWTTDTGGRQPIGWFFGIGLDYISIGAGLMGFEKDTLTQWRLAIDGPHGPEFAETIEQLKSNGFRVADPELKRVPSPYDKDHPRGELLKRKSLSAWRDYAEALDAPTQALQETFKDLSPLTKQLRTLT